MLIWCQTVKGAAYVRQNHDGLFYQVGLAGRAAAAVLPDLGLKLDILIEPICNFQPIPQINVVCIKLVGTEVRLDCP